MTNNRLRLLFFALSLLAIGGLLGAAAHGHADGGNHANCWLCLSSFGTVAVPALVISLFVSWTCLGLSREFVSTGSAQLFLPTRCSRAPPILSSI
jgi:hypothetical protein